MIQSIPTFYRGIHFRSRLEARWAAMFDLLRWPWVYEPFALKDYIPDFILPFEHGGDVLVEIKPYVRPDKKIWKPAMDKIEKSGWFDIELDQVAAGCEEYKEFFENGRPALILGATVHESYPSLYYNYAHDVVGFFHDGSIWSGEDWSVAYIVECSDCHGVFPYEACGERSCRRCGCDDKHYQNHFSVHRYWNYVKNCAQWKPGQINELRVPHEATNQS